MLRYLLKRRLKKDLRENVLYVPIDLINEDRSSTRYYANGFDETYLKFIDLEHFSQFAIKWTEIKHGWTYVGVSDELFDQFESHARQSQLNKLIIKQAVESLEGNRYRIPAYQDSAGNWFYITQSHNYRDVREEWGVTLYRGEEDQGPGMRAVPYRTSKAPIQWDLGQRERQPNWGRGISYDRPHHWLTVDALESVDGVLPLGDVQYTTARDGIERIHTGRLTVHPELLPVETDQPMSVNTAVIGSQLYSQLRRHYVDDLTLGGFILDQEAIYRDHYPKFVRDFMAGVLPGEQLTVSQGVALVAADSIRNVVLTFANRKTATYGLHHIHDRAQYLVAFNDDRLYQLLNTLNTRLYKAGVKAEDRVTHIKVEG